MLLCLVIPPLRKLIVNRELEFSFAMTGMDWFGAQPPVVRPTRFITVLMLPRLNHALDAQRKFV